MKYIIIAFFIVLEMKVLRDVIAFRYSRSLLTHLPRWMQRFLRSFYVQIEHYWMESVLDGWHFADAIMIAAAWILAIWQYSGSWWWAFGSYPVFWVVFYQAFNWQYHWLWMLPEWRESPWRRNKIKD